MRTKTRLSREELALLLYASGAIQLRDVNAGEKGFDTFKMHQTYPDAPKSPIKVSIRCAPEGRLSPKTVQLIGRHMAELACSGHWDNDRFDAVVGLPNAGGPIAQAFHQWYVSQIPPEETGLRLLTMEKVVTASGRQISPTVHGPYREGMIVAMVDDVITRSGSKLEGAEGLRANRLEVKDCFVLIDRGQGGRHRLAEVGIRLHSVFDLEEVLDIYQEFGLISDSMIKQIRSYKQCCDEYFARQSKL